MLDLPLDIAEEYEALTQFLYLAPVGLAQLDSEGEIAMLNPVAAQLLMPLSRDGGLSNLFETLGNVAPDLRLLVSSYGKPHGMICDALRLQLGPSARGAEPRVLALTLLRLDAHRLMAVLNDVSMQVKRERLLRQNEAWINAVLTGVTDYALVSLDGNGRITGWNPSIKRVTCFTEATAIGQPYSIFYPKDATTHDRLLDRLREADQNGWSLDDGWRMRADGSRFWGSAVIVPLVDRKLENSESGSDEGRDSHYCLIIRDITDKREETERHRAATACDHLTGVANRRTFFEAAELEVERYLRSPRPLSLVLIDADHFKSINDGHGHPAGDEVLRHLAQALTATFRQVDVVARVGGEEFAVLLPSTDMRGAAAVAERLRATVEAATVMVDGQPIRYKVSAGVAAMDDGTADLDALMKRADRALYAAKHAGRNQVKCAEASAPTTVAA